MRLCITVPAYNEERCLRENVRKLIRFLDQSIHCSYEVLIAENGSTDRTLQIATELAREAGIRMLHLERPGRGRALRAAWALSDAQVLGYTDADLSTDLSCVPDMLDLVSSGAADIAVGSRLLPRSKTRRCWKREIISRVYAWVTRRLLATSFSDPQCGLKMLRREVAADVLPYVQDGYWFFDTELLFLAQRRGWRIADIPVCWTECQDSHVAILRTVASNLCGLWRLRRNPCEGHRRGTLEKAGQK